MTSIVVDNLVVDVSARLDKLDQGMKQAKATVSSAYGDIGHLAAQAERQIVSSSAGSARALEQVRTASGATRAGMQQLSFQLSDVAQGFSLGVSPMTIFAQQSGQVIQALQLMSGESKGLIGFLGGPWGIALSAAASVAVALGSALFDGADAADKMADHQSDLADYVDMTTGKIKDQVAAISLLVEAQRRSKSFGEQVQEYRHNRNALAGAASSAGNGEFSGNLFAPRNFAKPALSATQQQIKTLGDQYRRGEINANALGVAVHKIGLEDPSVRKITDGIERLADATVRSAQSAVKTQASIAVLSGTASDAQKKMLGIATATDTVAEAHNHSASAARNHASATNEVAQQIDLVGDAAKGANDAVDRLMKRLPGSSDAFAKAQAEAFRRIFGNTDDFDAIVKNAETAFKARQSAELQAEDDLQRVREAHIRTTANLYYDLFSGGTHRVWQDFERMGLQIISRLLAEWTISSFAPKSQGGTGGGLGSILGSLGSIFGGGGGSSGSGTFSIPGIGDAIPYLSGARAGGGPVEAGRLYKINEQGTEGFRPQGSGTIIPLGKMKAAMPAASGTVVNQTIAVDARGAVMNDKFASMILARSAAYADAVSTARSKEAVQAAPGKVAQFNRFGN